jgi:tetratricopeptide (TPR) repeat protein
MSAVEYYNRGESYRNKGDHDRAIADYTEAIRLDPQFAIAYNNRGVSYNGGKKDYDRAIADYTEAIRLNPQYALAYNNRGNAYQAKGNQARADADFAEARRLGYTGN